MAAISILRSAKHSITFNVVHSGLSTRNKLMIRGSLLKHRCSIAFLYVDDSILSGFTITDHISLATYYRILLPTIMPDHINKILFLDADIVVLQDLGEIYDSDIREHACAVVETPISKESSHLRELRMKGERYFNAGVMLINLEYWRQRSITTRLLSWINDYPGKLRFWDQDALNAVLEGKWLRLEPKWNATHAFFISPQEFPEFSREETHDAINNPAIIHFTGGGSNKPWRADSVHPKAGVYWYFFDQTIYKYVDMIKDFLDTRRKID